MPTTDTLNTASTDTQLVFQDVTAEKSATVKELERAVEDARKRVADAQATYNSFATKSQLMNGILSEASAHLTAMSTHDKMTMDSVQKVHSLTESAIDAMATSKDTYIDTEEMLKSIQEVVYATIEAATEIALTAELILQRKATNPLISSQLVSQATQAATDAGKAVTLINKALTATYVALSTAGQASFTSEITRAEVQYLKKLVVWEHDPEEQTTEGPSIEQLVKGYYLEARASEKNAQQASDESQQQLIKAKNDLNRTTTNLSNVEAALKAARSTIGVG